MPDVLVTTRLFDDDARALLERNGCRVVTAGRPPEASDGDLGGEELRALLAPCSGWIVGLARVTRAVMEAAPGLRVIARRGVGYDRVDVAAARDLGRAVTVSAGGNDASVADHTLALMLAGAKRLGEMQAAMRVGAWQALTTGDLHGKTVGLLGVGRIGRGVARRLAGFDVRVLACDVAPDASLAGVAYVDLETLAAESDFVSLHIPFTAATRHVVDAAFLARMKPQAFLVNTARGGLIDEAALLAALRERRIAGAGLDVFEAEDDPALRPIADALVAMANVVASPHAAGSSSGALARGNWIAAENVLAVLNGQALPADRVVAPPG